MYIQKLYGGQEKSNNKLKRVRAKLHVAWYNLYTCKRKTNGSSSTNMEEHGITQYRQIDCPGSHPPPSPLFTFWDFLQVDTPCEALRPRPTSTTAMDFLRAIGVRASKQDLGAFMAFRLPCCCRRNLTKPKVTALKLRSLHMKLMGE